MMRVDWMSRFYEFTVIMPLVSMFPVLASMVINDPTWFPSRYDAQADRVAMLKLGAEVIGEASFLDQRLPVPMDQAIWQPLPFGHPLAAPPAWLFHSAFCGSTLLSRALQAPPDVTVLREPSALLDLALARSGDGFLANDKVIERARRLVALLARPWAADGRVVIKPTNQVNRILPALLHAEPHGKALLLYSSLEQFLLSCCKKLPNAEMPLRWMAQALLPGTDLERRLGIPSGHPLSFSEAAVLTWFAQMEIYAHALAGDHQGRLRSLDMQALLDAPLPVARATARWLGLDMRLPDLSQSVAVVFSRNAKDATQAYDPNARARERQRLMKQYGAGVERMMTWAEEVIVPAATLPVEWRPLLTAG